MKSSIWSERDKKQGQDIVQHIQDGRKKSEKANRQKRNVIEMWTGIEIMRSTDKADINKIKNKRRNRKKDMFIDRVHNIKVADADNRNRKMLRKIKHKRSENSKEEIGKHAIHENMEGPEILNPDIKSTLENSSSIKAAMPDVIIIKILLPFNDFLR